MNERELKFFNDMQELAQRREELLKQYIKVLSEKKE